MELIALRVTAEVVMIVNDKNPRIGPDFFLIKVRSRQATNATANNYQIVLLSGINGVIGALPPCTVTH